LVARRTEFQAVRHNLPAQPTAFVGRQTDLAQIAARLADPACRLLTIVGPGGMGKTRLAIQVAQDNLLSAAARFSDGIFFVALAGVASPDLLVSTIAATLDFTFYGSAAPKTQLLEHLRLKTLLLVLDNFEHLLDGGALVAEILNASTASKVIVTSREALNLREEWLHPLTGMSFPTDPKDSAPLESYTAVQFFAQCARQLKPSFDLVVEATAVVRICRLVEGMPLGIELAASWLKHFPCTQIAREIEQSLDFLATTLRNVPARHRSMRAVFEHSWNLLAPAEQQVFQRLAVFRGGFRLEAAQQVAVASFPLLVSLAEKSLVQVAPSGRYQMHELLRQFAEEKLQAVPHTWSMVQTQHSNYHLHFLRHHAVDLEGRCMAVAMAMIEEEIENVRAAWHWALRYKHIEAIESGLAGLHLFFWLRRWYQEGETLFAQTVSALRMEKPAGQQGILLGHSLVMHAYLLHLLYLEIGHSRGWERVESLYLQSLAILNELSATAETGMALLSLGNYYREVGELASSLASLEQALVALTAQPPTLWLRRVLHDLGLTHFTLGHYETALEHFQRCAALCEERDDLKTLGDALNMIGESHRAQGDYSAARQATQAAFNVRTTVNDKRGIAWSLQLLGEIAWHTKDYATAQRCSGESLTLLTEMGLTREGNPALNTLGRTALSLGDYAEARRHFHAILTPQLKTGQLALVWTEVAALVGLGSVLAQEGRCQEAVELLTHVLRYPAGFQETKVRATALLAELALEMSAEQFHAAQARATRQDLAQFVADLLIE